MKTAADDEIIRTHLEDLQSEMEAGARKLSVIADDITAMRKTLLSRQMDQAALAGTLVRRIVDLRRCVRQQRETLAELRRAVRQRASGTSSNS